MRKTNKKGFTLIEIMIVVVIIGLLAALAIPAFETVRGQSHTKAVVANLRKIGTAAATYFMENADQATVTLANLETLGYLDAVPANNDVIDETYPTSVNAGAAIAATSAGKLDNAKLSYSY